MILPLPPRHSRGALRLLRSSLRSPNLIASRQAHLARRVRAGSCDRFAARPAASGNLIASRQAHVEAWRRYGFRTSSKKLLYFALVFSIWFPLRAAKCLMRSIRMAYHSGKPQKPFYYTLRQLVYTLVLLLIIGVTLLLPTFASRVMKFIHNTL